MRAWKHGDERINTKFGRSASILLLFYAIFAAERNALVMFASISRNSAYHERIATDPMIAYDSLGRAPGGRRKG